MKSARFGLACIGLLAMLKITAQCPPPGSPSPGNVCPTAPIYCGNLDGFCSTTDNDNQVHAFPGCTGFQLNNDEWLAFIAGTNSITLRITPSNCTDDSTTNTGLQGGIYEACGPPWIPKDLQCVCIETPFILSSNSFVIGQIYYLVIDGCTFNTCDFSIEVLDGSTFDSPPADPGPVAGPAQACKGSTAVYSVPPVSGATNHFWTLTPPDAGVLTGDGPQATVEWAVNAVDTAVLCVTTGNPCFSNPTPACITVAIPSPAAPSALGISCPPNLQILGGMPAVAAYDLPDAASDCSCPGVSLALTEGLPAGSIFPTGSTKICYTAKDSCGSTATCCFEVNIPELPPCSAKKSGCMGYELLDITLDAPGNKRYRYRVRNGCSENLVYTAFQLPNGAVAVSPPDNSVYTSPAGREYLVRNPANSPFYSIRFQPVSDSIADGEADIFEYTLKPQFQPAYVHVAARLETQAFYDAYLGTSNCPLQMPPPAFRSAPATSFRIYPNPATGVLYADLSTWQEEPVQIRVLDSRGQEVYRIGVIAGAAPGEILLPEKMAGGLYFFEAEARNGERRTARFVLMR